MRAVIQRVTHASVQVSGQTVGSIARGYQRRFRPLWEMARLNAYTSAYCMGSRNAKPLTSWMPLWWEKEAGDEPITKEEADRLRELIRLENEKRAAK